MRVWLGHGRGGVMAVRVIALLALGARSARAYDASVDASLDVQYYSLASPFGDPVVMRRRYTSTLGLDVLNLQGAFERDRPTLGFRSRMRVDADFGIRGAELDPSSDAYVPGLEQAPLDLMYAYLEADRLAGGLFGLRLGRQYVIDAGGFWSFDGLLGRVALPIHLELSGFVGFEQRTGLPMLGTPRFAAEGVWRGDRADLELRDHPAFLDDSALAPAAGVALETVGVPGVHARLAYRTVQSRSAVLVSPFLERDGQVTILDQTRTASARAAASLRFELGDWAVSTDGVYDLYVQRISDAAAALDWFATSALTLGVDADYAYPTYDGDSIFNWFSHGPNATLLGRLSIAPSAGLDAAVSWGTRLSETRGDPEAPSMSTAQAAEVVHRHAEALLNASARYRFRDTVLTLSGIAEGGEAAHRAGADFSVFRSYQGGRYDALVVVSLYDWSDALRATRDATSFTYVLGAGLVPAPTFWTRARLGAEWEHTMNRLVGQRFRVLLTLDLTVLR